MDLSGSEDSSSSTDLNLFQNISHLDLSHVDYQSPSTPKSQLLKIDLAYKGKGYNDQAKKQKVVEYSSMITSNYTPDSFHEISDDVTLLKQTLANLINQINTKNKEKYQKKEKIHQLEGFCDKNRRKIKRMKDIIRQHEEKIIGLESKLNYNPGSLSDRTGADKTNWKHFFLDKNLVPSQSLRQIKNVNLILSGSKPSAIGLADKQNSPQVKKKKIIR